MKLINRMRAGFSALMVFGLAASNLGLGTMAQTQAAQVTEVSGLAPQASRQAYPNEITLALKFVEFAPNGRPVLSRPEAARVVDGINSVYAQCGLRVRLEQYEQVDPARYGLDHKITSSSQMDSVRAPFDSDQYLVVIHTGAWNHGPMGPANAWTAMPGQLPSGAVLEAPVASNGNITAHEIGHYLGLDHAHNHAELMNPIIYQDSIRITPAQCEQMRTTAVATRAKAIRSSLAGT